MIETAKALQKFWSSFGLDAYVEGSIPDGAQMPYITYRLVKPDWRSPVQEYARLWYHSTSYADVLAKVDEIRHAIGEGYSVPIENGVLVLYRDDVFAQTMTDEEPDVKYVYLTLQMNVYNS